MNSSISVDPYWWGTQLKSFSDNPPLPGNIDILVVGAGYTGLSAARVAHDLGSRTVVVDAGEAGKGASTRNGGMFGAHPRVSWKELSLNFGEDTADKIFAESSEALFFVKDFIRDESIECDLDPVGRIQLAWSEGDFEKQNNLARVIQSKSDVKVKLVKRSELSQEIKTNRYYGGLLFKEHCGINPAKLHSGMIRALTSRGVPILQNMPVLSIKREYGGFRVQFLDQDVLVNKVIMATNGYTVNDFSWYKRRVVPVPSFLITTEELPLELIKELSPRGRMMVETRAKYSYYRLSPDKKRIIFGGRAAIKPIALSLAARRLKASLDDIWPEVKSYKVTNVWTGNTGYSFNHMPHVGCKGGIYYAMGYSGSGTVLAAYLGAKVAFMASDDPRAKTAYSKTKLRTSLVHFFEKPYFLSLLDFWYQNVIDRWQSRLDSKNRS